MVNLRRPLLVALLTFELASCSSHETQSRQLSAGDQAVCNAAHAQNARTVYNVRNQPEDAALKKQATRIYPGSSDTSDRNALNAINNRCKDLGYHAA